MPSIRQLAKKLGVSPATVSRALNNSPTISEATRKRVVTEVNASKYAPSMGRRSTNVIGLVYISEPFPQSYGGYEGTLVSGIIRGLNERRFDVTVLSPQRDKSADESFTQFFMRKGVRGVLIRASFTGRTACEEIAAENFPHVVLAERFDAPNVNYIYCDCRCDSRRAVEHLIEMGHQRIGLCVHFVPDEDHMDREAGYREAMEAAGLPLQDEWIIRIGRGFAGGAQALTKLLSLREPPTAAYCADPALTLGMLRRAHELKLQIPQEFSVVGFDDTEVRYTVYPTYTAVCQDVERLGYEGALWLTRHLSGQSEPELRRELSTILEVNGTTTSAPATPVRVLPDGTRVVNGVNPQ